MRKRLLLAVVIVCLLFGILAPMILLRLRQRNETFVRSHARTFGYIHYETIGIGTYVLDHGKEIPVLLTPSSDHLATASFYALKWNVESANADGKHLFLVGYLDPAVKWTYEPPRWIPGMPAMAGSEPYHDFTLLAWYIETPFEDFVELASGDLSSRKRKRTSLSREDFTPFDGRETFDAWACSRKRPAVKQEDRRK